MPATLTIKTSRSGAKAIDYSSARNGKDKAHNNYKMKRVLASSGVNCTPANGKAKMQAIWRKKKTKQKQMIEAYTIVQSFDPENFDYRKEEDVKLVNEMGQELVKNVVPSRLALVYTQADGTHHVLHNHIIICNQDPYTLKAMRAEQTMFKTWAWSNDATLRAHNLDTLQTIDQKYANAKEKLTRAEIGASESKEIQDIYGNKMVRTGTVTRTEKIKERIEVILDDPSVNSWQKFQEKAKAYDLDVKIRYNKQKKINGLSYRLVDDDKMKRGIRAKRLGTRYMKDEIDDILRQNIEKYKQQQIKQDQAKQREAEQRKREIERKQREARQRAELARRKTRQHLITVGENVDHPSVLTIIARSTKPASRDVESDHQQTASPTKQPEQSIDNGPSIFDDYNSALRKHIKDSNNNASRSSDGSKGKSTIDELIQQLQQQHQLESAKRKQLNRQLAANAEFIIFSRNRANKLAHWVDKYYRKSIKFVEQHLSSARHIVQKLTNSISKPSIQLNESNNEYRNRNEQPRPSGSNYETRTTSNKRHAKIDPNLDPASKLSTNHHQFDNQIDDDIPF